MSEKIHDKKFPGESAEYRAARNNLLKAEIDLRQKIEDIGRMKQALPLGGKLKEDYIFTELINGQEQEIKLSELFEGNKDSLIIYSYMYGPKMENPCPACTSLIDGFNGTAMHITDRVNLAVVAKSSIKRIAEFAGKRNWNNIHLLSSENNSYNSDYFAQTPHGAQIPACNVFTKTADGIFHFYSTELLYAPLDGQPRHMDLMWPVWNMLDITPEGRGTDWHPKLSYD
ncbi:MAG: DUF899 domain-containing protein [Candidatus Dadabacteria bacterium]|nr:DUF899 domain-containing protein [Candidatus Dadabacteria bacterium]NIS08705.1 DUF899 domain-containing protein [Candidatus Dadabacteria bacterium]NIV42187.1 DUF899 domain-containing protein [Candidatus Dadabacteria bacterium]NIX15391.1 DUF899 domain-containing protein [Candidatus Dadabacteria bacterium]NIY22054.1 DUF899 domain-containing protein [Candidatus Dadabacteria bacterium]